MKQLIAFMMIIATPLFASSPVIFQQGSLVTITNNNASTNGIAVMTEMTDLIRAQRAYEMNSKVMGVADQMMQTINNIR